MAIKIANSNTIVRIDNSGGTLKDITSDVTEIDGLDRTWAEQDITAFSDSETRQIKVFPNGTEVTFRGNYRSGSSDADAHFRGLLELSGTSAVNTVEVKPDGTRLVSFEGFLSQYRYQMRNKEIVGWEAVYRSDGAVTFASSS